MDIFALFLILVDSIHSLTIKCDVSSRFFIDAINKVEKITFY